ncbi:CBM9 family sugar-binding protein [Thalassotalea psychrophila]|uniref:CBM9 family sugar-binding protein n=1 Tax=Thalassotalea psychrophila TaxID=3065647 RepID=A0ABY9TS35_9GAMM|nr:CBM9 family sugar-binding protein [Colwelliaceae bacterium SQ149]
MKHLPRLKQAMSLCCLFFAIQCLADENIAAVVEAESAITIDGKASEQAWNKAQWSLIDKHIVGEYPSSDDFSGRFKLLWDEDYLYLMAEIRDDVLFDQYANPTEKYWDDDSLEVFIDEDASGGKHQFSFNAFAYHVALDNQVADIGPKNSDGSTNFILLNEHVQSGWQRNASPENVITWELAIKLYDDSFTLKGKHTPVKLTKGKVIGFMLAYCDNDGSKEREHFIGSDDIKPKNGDKNLGYIDASVFGKIKLH